MSNLKRTKPKSPRCPNLSDIQTNNAVYSEAEQTVIKAALKTAEDSIGRLRALRKNTGTNTTKRRELEDQIRRYHIALAPFRRVPNEIWMYIFELHCRSSWLNTCHKIKPPVVLMQVCSTWRQMVISMPILWSDVHIGKKTDLARMWLERAGSIPRAFDATQSHKFNQHEEIQNILCSFPFRKLHLTEYDAAKMEFREIPEESLLPLEDLAVVPSSIYNATTDVSFDPHPFPNLVSLHIRARHIPRFHVLNPFSTWKELRVLRLECELSVSKCLDILSDASSVKNCTLRYFPASSGMTTGNYDRSVEHTNLRVLTLFFPSFVTISCFLDCLTCPNLQTLIRVAADLYRDVPSLLSLGRFTGSLRSLIIRQSYIGADISLVLECLPLLQVLELHCEQITDKTGEKIGKGELGGCLRELHDWNTCNLNQLLQACELRRNITQGLSQNNHNPTAMTCLKNVSVRFYNPITDHSVRCRIYKLRKEGIEFNLKHVSDRTKDWKSGMAKRGDGLR